MEKKKHVYLSWRLLLKLPFYGLQITMNKQIRSDRSFLSISSLNSRYLAFWYDEDSFFPKFGFLTSDSDMKISKIWSRHHLKSTSCVCVPLFSPDFRRFGFENERAGYRPDRTGQIFRPAGPDRLQKICPVPPLYFSLNISESNGKCDYSIAQRYR